MQRVNFSVEDEDYLALIDYAVEQKRTPTNAARFVFEAGLRSLNLKKSTQSAPVELLLPEHSFTCGDEEKSNTANPSRKKHISKTTEVFTAYAKTCLALWGFEPPRDARGTRNAKDLIAKVGYETALEMAQLYPSIKKAYYIERGHPFSLMLSDSNAILRQLRSGVTMTSHLKNKIVEQDESRQFEKQFGKAADPFEAIGASEKQNDLPEGMK